MSAVQQRVALAALLSAVLLVVGPTSASATTRVTVNDPIEGESLGDVSVDGDEGPNHIVVSWSRERKAVIVQARDRVESDRCDRITARRVSCPYVYEDLWVSTKKGPDHIVIRRGVTQFDTVFVLGGTSHDTLVGGGGEDALDGGDGDDVLDGRGGDDSLIGDWGPPIASEQGDDILRGGSGDDDLGIRYDHGRDQLFGGRGKDQLIAKDESADRVIDAGRGQDRCTSDPDDPYPVRCGAPGGRNGAR